MKALLTSAVLALSLNAFAVSANSTWSEVIASKKTVVEFPQISFAAGEVTTLVSIDQVCSTDAGFQTVKAQPVYAHVGNGDNASIEQVGSAVLTSGPTFIRHLAVSETKYVDVVEAIPHNYEIVVRAASYGDNEGRVLFTKAYSIPACNAKLPVAPIAD